MGQCTGWTRTSFAAILVDNLSNLMWIASILARQSSNSAPGPEEERGGGWWAGVCLVPIISTVCCYPPQKIRAFVSSVLCAFLALPRHMSNVVFGIVDTGLCAAVWTLVSTASAGGAFS